MIIRIHKCISEVTISQEYRVKYFKSACVVFKEVSDLLK